MDGHVRDKVG